MFFSSSNAPFLLPVWKSFLLNLQRSKKKKKKRTKDDTVCKHNLVTHSVKIQLKNCSCHYWIYSTIIITTIIINNIIIPILMCN